MDRLPSLLTLLLLLTVMIAPPAGLIDPAVVTWMSPAPAVFSAVVVAVLMVVSATAREGSAAAIAPRPEDASKKRMKRQVLFPAAPPRPICCVQVAGPREAMPARIEDSSK